jgi:DNA-binding CsgD family transcriptional regulator
MPVSESSVVACVGNIYQAAYDPARWATAIESLRLLFHGSRACLVRIGPDRQPTDLVAPNNDPAFQDRYLAEFAHEPNVVEGTVARAPVGLAYSDISFIGKETLRASRLWNEWMAPQDMYGGLTSKLLASGQSSWFFDVQRGRNQVEFDGTDLELLKTISSHLSRAIEIGRQTRIGQLISSSLSHLPFAVLGVDRSMRVLAQNPATERMLCECNGSLSLRRGVLVASRLSDNARLQRLVAQSCAARDGVLPGLGGDLLIGPQVPGDDPAVLAISVGPMVGDDLPMLALERCAIVIVRRIARDLPVGFAEAIGHFFDLTPREADIAAGLAAGQSLKTIADQTGIQFSTARTHLGRVFRKTGTNQQSQLVAMLKNVQLTLPRQ